MNTGVSIIRFYSTTNEYGFLSNFYPSPIVVDGKYYYHTEGYYQSQKHQGTNNKAVELIRKAQNPLTSKILAGKYFICSERLANWNSHIKYHTMKQALYAKFIQHSDLAKKLADTGDAILIEDSSSDRYWGQDRDGNGENNLGKLLMEVRGMIKYIR